MLCCMSAAVSDIIWTVSSIVFTLLVCARRGSPLGILVNLAIPFRPPCLPACLVSGALHSLASFEISTCCLPPFYSLFLLGFTILSSGDWAIHHEGCEQKALILDTDLAYFPGSFQDIFGEWVGNGVSSQLVSVRFSARSTSWLPTVCLTTALSFGNGSLQTFSATFNNSCETELDEL